MNSIAEAWTFAAAKMGAEIIPGLLDSIRKATLERREYGKGDECGGIKVERFGIIPA